MSKRFLRTDEAKSKTPAFWVELFWFGTNLHSNSLRGKKRANSSPKRMMARRRNVKPQTVADKCRLAWLVCAKMAKPKLGKFAQATTPQPKTKQQSISSFFAKAPAPPSAQKVAKDAEEAPAESPVATVMVLSNVDLANFLTYSQLNHCCRAKNQKAHRRVAGRECGMW